MDDAGACTTSIVRLRPCTLLQLPAHPAFASSEGPPPSTHPSLSCFLSALLLEATARADSIATDFKLRGSKPSPPAEALVESLCGVVRPRGERGAARHGETWFARRSVHEDARRVGTADWEEFDDGIRVDHARKEGEYTPDVLDARRVLDWADELAKAEVQVEGCEGAVELSVHEMCHSIPTPLCNRTFTVLVASFAVSPAVSLVAQIPVDLSTFPAAFRQEHVMYANGRHRQAGASGAGRGQMVVGEYVSVERITRVEQDGKKHVRWEMATASDAKGWLPAGMQKLGIPGAIRKDVGLFLRWTADRRGCCTERR
ncbi:hypothetical protein BDY21DRAFT_345681 [Lineolata rhizophorae]|uniref:DUF3074 domain-containing protein n=1 Tax=Lineolata rhizophorae TaxID=578093 RepID=A0A6A6NY08_9PEZI|nr:hypothetical protein BDY21DRAFT_345681 [Lineolata rhizophorae]